MRVTTMTAPAARLWREAVAAAVQAPSIHNSQPWRFVAEGDQLRLYADRHRHLPAVDPTGRELHLSCGAALLHVELAVHAAGRECTIAVMPDAEDRDLLATVTLGSIREVTPTDRRLLSAVPRRHTNRQPFTHEPIPEPLLHQWRHGVEARGAWLHVLHRPDDILLMTVLLAQAHKAERADPAYLQELSTWTAGDRDDGVPSVAWRDSATVSAVPLRDFGAAQQQEVAGCELPPPVEHPQLLLICTERDDPLDWLQAGTSMEWLLLEATSHALAASPITQVLDWPAYRSRVAPLLGLLGYAQMLLRVGQPTAGPVRTPRRPVDKVLTTQSSDWSSIELRGRSE